MATDQNKNVSGQGSERERNHSMEQHGNSADHVMQTDGQNWTKHKSSFESDEERSVIRPDSVESDSNKLEGKNDSSDYIDTDDEKDLGTQSGTFFDDEQTPRGH
jgi:hypothetical protein